MSILLDLTAVLSSQAHTPDERELVGSALQALDAKFALTQKITREPGLEEIFKQLVGRVHQAYGSFAGLAGQRILDIACGSNTSKAPSFVFVDTPFGEQRIPIPAIKGYTAQFEPWFCRMIHELGADPVGVDLGNLEAESFEHYRVDLGQPGGLNFLADHSFDAVQDSRLFGSPEFTTQFPNRSDLLRVAGEIWKQEQRLLKANGKVIHSDAATLLQ